MLTKTGTGGNVVPAATLRMPQVSFSGLPCADWLPGQDRAVQPTRTRSGHSVCPKGHLWGLSNLLERSEMHATVHPFPLAIKHRLLKDLAGR